MAATIKIKNSSTASAVPTSSDLVQGELAVNVTDKRIFTENASGTVVELGTNPSSITLPAGSASAPTLLASGDTNTGLFFPAADTIALTTGGGERLRLDSSGNLGIGSTSPASNNRLTASLSYDGSGGLYVENTSTGTSASSITRYKNSGSTVAYVGLGGASRASYAGLGANILALYTDNTAGIALTVDAVGPLTFNTNSTERARIDSSGNLLVGATSVPSAGSGGSGFYVDSNSRRGLAMSTTSTSANTLVAFMNPNGTVGSINTSGSATSYATSSDYRLKNTVAPMTGALAKVAALKPVTYKWNADNSDGEGFIAHELAEVVPQAVIGEKDAVNDNGDAIYQAIDTSFLVATLTAAIQELNAKFEAYKASHP